MYIYIFKQISLFSNLFFIKNSVFFPTLYFFSYFSCLKMHVQIPRLQTREGSKFHNLSVQILSTNISHHQYSILVLLHGH